ncbi:MAG: phage tail spike protein [Clostridium sp.]|uniref:phage tail spike protein n=1 Tax=Clostridium sp. TaxID=1506 RepID=UPI002914FE12|nr:phage tail spike protein [Clostridium sp.]MDU7948688.1 phage tail spike protein [Clostridium sp.]
MIKIFKQDETDFSHDGIEVLDDIAISSYTDWSEKNKWIIQAKFKKDFDKSETIKEGLIIQVPTEKGEQLFRILKINKKNRKYISISGHAIGYDFNDNFIQDINIVEKSGRVAIHQISNGTVYPHRYNISSNIDRVASARMVRKNGIEALIGTNKDNTFIERWGGCLVLDNFNISVNEAVGEDRGVEIAIGKNVTAYDGDIDEEAVCTGINAITYDGLTLPEGIYYSPLVNNYPHPKIREFKFDNIKYKYSENNNSEEGYETLEEVYEAIRKACNDLFNIQNIDKPTCSLRVNIAALENTDQYKGDELNERIFQGDILTANLEDYGFNVKLKMIANRYDNIRKRYIDIDLGDAKNNIFNDINKIEIVIGKVVEQLGGNSWKDILDKSMKEASELIAAGIKDSYVVARKNEILIMDSPKVESAINVIRMNKNGIAFSRSGYNGPYTLAITIDGKINASCILTGELDAALIKTGLLSSKNGTAWIDMDNGTFNFANKVKFDGANFEIDLSGKDLATNEQVKSIVDMNSNSLLAKVSSTNKLIAKNAILTGDFTSSTGSSTIGSWIKNTISASASAYSTDGTNWCNFYTSTLAGELFAYQDATVEVGKPYEFSCKIAKYSSVAQYYCIRIQEYSNSTWNTVKEFNGIVDVDRSNPLVLYTKYKPATSQVRIWIGKTEGNKFNIYATDFQLFYTTDIVKSAELNILSEKIESKVSSIDFGSTVTQLNNSISSKVSNNDFSTKIEQNAYSVRIAWNKISNYVQFENGGISIYNGSVNTSQKRAVFDEVGNHFWRDGYYLGKIGTNQYSGDTSIKGIVFDLESDGGYMTWAVKKYSGASIYDMVWTYANRTVGNYSAGKLHAGADIDMHNFYLRNVKFEGGGITGTMNFVQVTAVQADGKLGTWYNNCKLQFQNGILISGTWG